MPKTIKTRSGRVLQLPTPEEDAIVTAAANADPDAVPLTDAEWETVKPLVRRGRPLGSGTKTQVTLRLDVDVLEKFKASGDGWQTRINDALKSWVHTFARLLGHLLKGAGKGCCRESRFFNKRPKRSSP